MAVLEEYLINGDDLTVAQIDRMGQAVLRAIQADAVRFQTDIPAPKPDYPPVVHVAADVLRTAAGKTSEKDRKYALTGRLDATDPDLWNAYVTFMPWSIEGDVWDREGCLIVKVDDGVVTTIAVAPDQLPAIASIVGPERLERWIDVKARRRAEQRRWMGRHPDTLIGWIAVAFGLLLIPLPGPGWPLLGAGALLLAAGATVRSVVGRRRPEGRES